MNGESAEGSHALQQWQTVKTHTHKPSDTNYTLWLASILPRFQSIHVLCSRSVTFQQKDSIGPTRAMDQTGSEGELIKPDLECEPDPVGWGSRLGGGGMVWCSPFCSHLQYLVVKMSFLKTLQYWILLFLRSDSFAKVWLIGNTRSQFQRNTCWRFGFTY